VLVPILDGDHMTQLKVLDDGRVVIRVTNTDTGQATWALAKDLAKPATVGAAKPPEEGWRPIPPPEEPQVATDAPGPVTRSSAQEGVRLAALEAQVATLKAQDKRAKEAKQVRALKAEADTLRGSLAVAETEQQNDRLKQALKEEQRRSRKAEGPKSWAPILGGWFLGGIVGGVIGAYGALHCWPQDATAGWACAMQGLGILGGILLHRWDLAQYHKRQDAQARQARQAAYYRAQARRESDRP